ncbi:hypothetical protein AB837_00584 [bacterium AB1]|nr:hypothetical protein AB837_00584 [bacterium AB1]
MLFLFAINKKSSDMHFKLDRVLCDKFDEIKNLCQDINLYSNLNIRDNEAIQTLNHIINESVGLTLFNINFTKRNIERYMHLSAENKCILLQKCKTQAAELDKVFRDYKKDFISQLFSLLSTLNYEFIKKNSCNTLDKTNKYIMFLITNLLNKISISKQNVNDAKRIFDYQCNVIISSLPIAI